MFFRRIDLKRGSSVKEMLRIDVKKRSRVLFQIRDAELHANLAEDGGLSSALPIVHMTHTLPDVPWTKLFLEKPTATFVEIMRQVLWEHKCILDSIEDVQKTHRPSDTQKHRLKLAMRNHMRMTLHRHSRERDKFPTVSFELEDVVTYPLDASESDFAIFAFPTVQAAAEDSRPRATQGKRGKEKPRKKRSSR
jgi:hypothetical protein